MGTFEYPLFERLMKVDSGPPYYGWHGATPNTAMMNIAIHEELNGRTTDWLDHLTEEEYTGRQNFSDTKHRF